MHLRRAYDPVIPLREPGSPRRLPASHEQTGCSWTGRAYPAVRGHGHSYHSEERRFDCYLAAPAGLAAMVVVAGAATFAVMAALTRLAIGNTRTAKRTNICLCVFMVSTDAGERARDTRAPSAYLTSDRQGQRTRNAQRGSSGKSNVRDRTATARPSGDSKRVNGHTVGKERLCGQVRPVYEH